MTPDIERAKNLATLAHAGQTYNTEVPYVRHLEKVVEVLARFGYTDPEIICAAWLHDAIEDTNTSYNDIKKCAGEGAAELVYAVTSELGRNRKERNAKTYPKLRAAGERALALKLADRIANVEYGMATGGKNDMYAREFADFERALRFSEEIGIGGMSRFATYTNLEPMWKYLARLLQV